MYSLILSSLADIDLVPLFGILLPIIISLGAFLMIFGIRFLQYKENQIMIEKGLDPIQFKKDSSKERNSHSFNLTIGLVTIGIGSGILSAFLVTSLSTFKGEDEPVYFGLIFLLGGLGLLLSYFIQRKTSEKNP